METLNLALVGTGGVLDAYPPHGGWQRQIWGIGREWGRTGQDVVIYARRFEPGLSPPPRVRLEPIGNVPGVAVGSQLHFSLRARSRLAREDLDFAVLWGERFAYLFLTDTLARKGFVVDWDALPAAEAWHVRHRGINRLFLPLKYWAENRVRGACDILYAMNRYIEEALEAQGHPRVELLRLGIDPAAYEDRGWDDYLLFVGRLHASKGLEVLLGAVSRVFPEFPDFRLLVVGDGPDEGRLRTLAEHLGLDGRVQFVGRVTEEGELARLYSRCSAVVLPSYFEGFGVVLLEAMASGKPVIASDIPGPRDIVSHGQDGFLFPPGDVGSLARVLTDVMSDRDLRARLGRRGRREVEQNYTFQNTARSMLTTIRAVLEGGGRSPSAE